MHRLSDENLFVAFQQHRDVASLSTLFRRRADELLRLAVFLAPRPSDAEDLVQATFLSAIARAETYRDGYRVMSWLCGILTNHARMLRRAERRTPPGPLHAAEDHDPVGEALQSELRQALRRSIIQLGEPYRSVLTLHLNDGLNSHEISQRLSRPPATVRKQMARALQQLRHALPLGLATALVMRMSPAQIAVHAAEAAEFVDASTVATETHHEDLDDADTWCEVEASPLRAWWIAAVSVVAALLVVVVIDWSPAAPANTDNAVVTPAPENGTRKPVASSEVAAALADREPVVAIDNGHALTVSVADPNGIPHAGIEVLCVRDDGRALTTRLMSPQTVRSTTDSVGVARFERLEPGRYELTIAGSLPTTGVRVTNKDLEHSMTLPSRRQYAGTVTDAGGRPVAGATVLVGETGGRGEIPHAIAVTDATGYYEGSCLLWHGQVFARHPDHSQSACRRLIPGRPLQLELEPLADAIRVRVRDHEQRPVVGCFVAVVPKSQSMQFLVPHLQTTDDDGCCMLPGPGARHAMVIAQHERMAPASVELHPSDRELEITMPPSTRVVGVVRTHDGEPLANQEVVLTVPGIRTNEPIGPMLALRSRSDERGRFAFEHAPRADLHVCIYAQRNGVMGPPVSQHIVAGLGVDTRDGKPKVVELVARKLTVITGTLRTVDGVPIAGHCILAIPELGTATHRMFRRRSARTDAEGHFELEDVAGDEAYHLGVYPPERWWPNQMTWPIAIAEARCMTPCEIVVDRRDPSSSLSCQILRPDGKPARRASVELRHVSYHAPVMSNSDASGTASFADLPGGDYWLVVRAPGLGSRTMLVAIDGNQQALDLGVIQLERAARIAVRIVGRPRGAKTPVRVVARSTMGDKFVSAASRRDGVATLPPLPPGKSTLLLHGPGIAPRLVEQGFTPGIQWVDVDVETANAVTMRFPFPRVENPFLLNGPLHVRVLDAAGKLVLEDYVGATNVSGRFDLATGLRPGRYRVKARSLWNALADGEVIVPENGDAIVVDLPLVL